MSYHRHNKEEKRRWRDNNHYERHYCEICNVWMASDRASILTHENGKKHAEKVQEMQCRKHQETVAQEKQQAALQKSLQQMEAAAAASIQQDYGLFAGSSMVAATASGALQQPVSIPPVVSSHVPPPPAPPVSSATSSAFPSAQQSSSSSTKQEKKEWEARRKQRDEEKKKKRKEREGNESDQSDDDHDRKRRKVKIKENEGHYDTPDHKTWLEGIVFGDILEEDMPIQVWLGNANASDAELRLPENARHWKDGVVAAVRQRRPSSAVAHAERMVVDVAYLMEDDDTDEKLKKSVPLPHIRILLGNSAVDERIPDTLQEARLLAMGGEEIILKRPKKEANKEHDDEIIEEATGLTGWSTVKIKRTTIRTELKAEREQLRQKRRAAARQAEQQVKQAEARRMEEAKVANADDSALGAYDVWSRTKDGYKGVNIHHNGDTTTAAAVTVEELAKKLSEGKGNVGFKKSAFQAKKKKQNRRRTSADDDDDD